MLNALSPIGEKIPREEEKNIEPPSPHQDYLQPAPECSPDQLPEDVCPAHTCRMVDRGAAVVSAAIGVSPSFQEDLSTLEVPVDHSHVEGGLPLHIHQVNLSPFAKEEVNAGPVAGSGSDAQGCAG